MELFFLSDLIASVLRIPALIWDFIVRVILAPLWASVESLGRLIGLDKLFSASKDPLSLLKSSAPATYLNNKVQEWMPHAVNQYYAYTAAA